MHKSCLFDGSSRLVHNRRSSFLACFLRLWGVLLARGWRFPPNLICCSFAAGSWGSQVLPGSLLLAAGSRLARRCLVAGVHLVRGWLEAGTPVRFCVASKFLVVAGSCFSAKFVKMAGSCLVRIEWFVAGPAWLRGAVIPVGCAAWMVGGWSVAAT